MRRRKLGRRATYRETAELRRVVRLQREALRDLRNGGGTTIAQGKICESATAAIRTAKLLGYLCVVREHYDGTNLVVHAVQIP